MQDSFFNKMLIQYSNIEDYIKDVDQIRQDRIYYVTSTNLNIELLNIEKNKSITKYWKY